MLKISSALFGKTYELLRKCGQKERECQVLWLSAPTAPDTIGAVCHSKHLSDKNGLEVDSEWLTSLWVELARTGQSVRAQVHTHGGKAFHSRTDDDFPIVGTSGFVSVVIPYFATGNPDVDRLHVTQIRPQGGWVTLEPSTALLIT
jgi:hypothetical protein